MSMRTFSPPDGLPTGERVYPALLLPFDELPDPGHELAERSYQWGDVRLPRGALPILDGHDGEQVGIASNFVLQRDGIWAALKLGRRGEEILSRGQGVSVEIVQDEITHVALVGSATSGFRSARVVFDERFAASPGLHISSGSVAIGASHRTAPSPAVRSVMDLGAHRRESATQGMAAVDAEVAFRRREFERRQEELVLEELERQELRLMAGGLPVAAWPPHLPKRKQWDEMVARQEHERIIEYEGLRESQHLAFMVAAAAVPPPRRRRWWRWWK